MSIEQDKQRYLAAAHAMQSGVLAEMAAGLESATAPKHLRVGVNSAMVDAGAIGKLLMEKGVINEAEYFKAVADMMELEAKRYEDRLSAHYGKPIKLA